MPAFVEVALWIWIFLDRKNHRLFFVLRKWANKRRVKQANYVFLRVVRKRNSFKKRRKLTREEGECFQARYFRGRDGGNLHGKGRITRKQAGKIRKATRCVPRVNEVTISIRRRFIDNAFNVFHRAREREERRYKKGSSRVEKRISRAQSCIKNEYQRSHLSVVLLSHSDNDILPAERTKLYFSLYFLFFFSFFFFVNWVSFGRRMAKKKGCEISRFSLPAFWKITVWPSVPFFFRRNQFLPFSLSLSLSLWMAFRSITATRKWFSD